MEQRATEILCSAFIWKRQLEKVGAFEDANDALDPLVRLFVLNIFETSDCFDSLLPLENSDVHLHHQRTMKAVL